MGGAGETLERETEGEERGRERERGIRRLFWKIGSFNSLNYIPFGRVIEERKILLDSLARNTKAKIFEQREISRGRAA